MPSMTPFEFGNILLVPFPFTDQSTTKKRPAVVISSEAYNTVRPDLIIMAVTSQIKPASVIGEVIIQDWQAANLLKPSAIKPIITTIEKPLVIKTLGRLKEEDQKALQESLKMILG
ncbi:MAG: type II toxin-antitoxin system PemK/MazF family toxin [Gammaproteobacteria bacterium]|nr:type II toxin-antitoxin system PemK/MazF family toxin [Gammaproteobacteria bacterium]